LKTRIDRINQLKEKILKIENHLNNQDKTSGNAVAHVNASLIETFDRIEKDEKSSRANELKDDS
jgi:hypothetical protein